MKTVDEMIYSNHENYKEYLTLKSKTAKVELDKLKPRISWKKKELIKIIEKYQNQIDELINVSKEYEKDVQTVASEYSYRRKINSLLKSTAIYLWLGMVTMMSIPLGFILMTLKIVKTLMILGVMSITAIVMRKLTVDAWTILNIMISKL